MSAKQTGFPKKLVPARSINQGVVLVGKNGLPIDALSTLEPAHVIVQDTVNAVSYSAPTVTVNSSIDLTQVTNYSNFQYTGEILFTDASNNSFFIDKASINNTAHSFNIYINSTLTTPPSSINTATKWNIAEAELVNRLETTSAAVIDSVEFRDVNVQLQMTGKDVVGIVDENGHRLEINPDGSINVDATISVGVASSPTINNFSITNANTEYSFTLPSGTKKYSLKVRNDTSPLKLAFISGQSGTNYIKVNMGASYSEENIDLTSNLTLYFQTSQASQILEILYWQ